MSRAGRHATLRIEFFDPHRVVPVRGRMVPEPGGATDESLLACFPHPTWRRTRALDA